MEIQLGWRSRRGRRVLIASVAGAVVLGGVLVLLPREGDDAPPPAPGPAAVARGAVTTGVPAALGDLAVLIGDRESHLRAHPLDGASWAVLGSAYVEQGARTADTANWAKAEKALNTSLRVGPERDPQALEGLAALAVARRDFPAAKKWGESAARAAPKRWTAHAVLIDAYTGLGDHKGVGRALDKVLELRAGTPAAKARAAAVYRDRGWREDAAAQISDAAAAAAAPAERAAYLEQAGRLAFERGDPREALRFFQEALRTDPDQRAAQAGQGRAMAALGRTTDALTAYQAALAKRPSPEYALELGELYESLGLGQAARVQYDLLRARVRGAAAAGADEELVLGRFEADHGDPAAAVRRLRAEWGRQPGTAVADALGWALHRDGADQEALEFATIATDGEQGGGVRSALHAFHRGVIEKELERYGPARRHLREALMINPHFSPLRAPEAERALKELGEPSEEGPPD
ncbi:MULTISPECIES: tetratricopeptide repeat protein [Streptomyces]|uniref:Tetratricopeptide repeat protein n=1 Tax=Streptomyces parvulus TaxID=146923 RepID=A0ABV5DED1_9ACTN|nr:MULTISPECIES: tetratricopeptide repeat protein [Streptomyces]MCQ4197118.1 tetratricopeptide repeat protein [Streptomyces parvulus]WML80646.1 tetratricopeptide repeat protein [Streptomyces sp. VNUA74]